MSLYRFVRDDGNASGLEPVTATRLLDAGILERRDLQRALADNPSAIEPGLFVVAEEFTDWADSKRRVDLLCIDREANLVVVELKREDVGASMDLQAVRYAAMCSNLTWERLCSAHARYRRDRGLPGAAEDALLSFLPPADDDAARVLTTRPRIILLAEGFTSEVTTTVLWLNQCGLRIQCKRIEPYRMEDDILVHISQVIPLPEASDYLVREAERREEEDRARAAGTRGELTRRVLAEAGILTPGCRIRFDENRLNGMSPDNPRFRAMVGPDPLAARNIIWEQRPREAATLSRVTGEWLRRAIPGLGIPRNVNGYTYWCLADPGPGQKGKTLYELAVEVSAARGEPLPAPEADAL